MRKCWPVCCEAGRARFRPSRVCPFFSSGSGSSFSMFSAAQIPSCSWKIDSINAKCRSCFFVVVVTVEHFLCFPAVPLLTWLRQLMYNPSSTTMSAAVLGSTSSATLERLRLQRRCGRTTAYLNLGESGAVSEGPLCDLASLFCPLSSICFSRVHTARFFFEQMEGTTAAQRQSTVAFSLLASLNIALSFFLLCY